MKSANNVFGQFSSRKRIALKDLLTSRFITDQNIPENCYFLAICIEITKLIYQFWYKLGKRCWNDTIDVELVFSLSTLNKFQTLLECLYCHIKRVFVGLAVDYAKKVHL